MPAIALAAAWQIESRSLLICCEQRSCGSKMKSVKNADSGDMKTTEYPNVKPLRTY